MREVPFVVYLKSLAEALDQADDLAGERGNVLVGSALAALGKLKQRLRRCHELVGDGRIHQFCIRSGEREEFAFAKEHTQMQKFTFDGLEETVAQLKADGTPVYFTIDLDCLDPAVFAGTGTPEAGGVSFVQLLAALRCVCTANVIGADVNELAPMLDASGVSTATACKVLRELLLALHK